jgi:hypothetical protein
MIKRSSKSLNRIDVYADTQDVWICADPLYKSATFDDVLVAVNLHPNKRVHLIGPDVRRLEAYGFTIQDDYGVRRVTRPETPSFTKFDEFLAMHTSTNHRGR